jgi:hypothetical protein
MKTAPKCRRTKRKEQQQQITESERNVIAATSAPDKGITRPQARETTYTAILFAITASRFDATIA